MLVIIAAQPVSTRYGINGIKPDMPYDRNNIRPLTLGLAGIFSFSISSSVSSLKNSLAPIEVDSTAIITRAVTSMSSLLPELIAIPASAPVVETKLSSMPKKILWM